jgi:hypothetical protein
LFVGALIIADGVLDPPAFELNLRFKFVEKRIVRLLADQRVRQGKSVIGLPVAVQSDGARIARGQARVAVGIAQKGGFGLQVTE